MMKLLVTIKAGEDTQEIVLPVGHGTNTFKWLADAAAYRYVRTQKTHTLPRSSSLLPRDVYNADCPFFHPDDKIKDHVDDGSSITVELYTELPLDDYGIPKLSHWAFIAFRHEESQQERRQKCIEEKKQEVIAFNDNRERERRERQLEIERPKISEMRKIMADQLISDAEIERTVNEEWAQIKDSGVLIHIVPDESQQEEIRSFLLQKFLELSDLFKFYSAVNSGGGTHTLEFIELNKFLIETSILGEEHSSAILRIFIDSHISAKKSKVKPSIHSEIQRFEFFVSLIMISIFRYISIPKKEIARLKRQGQHVSAELRNVPTAPGALEMVYDRHLENILAKMPAGSKMRDAIASREVLLLFHDNLEALRACFDSFKDSESKDGLIRLNEFSSFSMRSGFFAVGGGGGRRALLSKSSSFKNQRARERKHSITGDKTSTNVCSRDIRQIFSASQNDAKEDDEHVNGGDEDIHHQEVMTFQEWLEAIARLGVMKFSHGRSKKEDSEDDEHEEEGLSYYECIKLAVEKVCSMELD